MIRPSRTHVVGFAALLAVAPLSACGGSGDSGSGSSDSITIGIKFDQPGLGLKDGSEYTGFDVAVARYVAEKMGYSEDQITWKQANSAQRESMIEGGQVDLIFATYSITEERAQKVSFAGPYFIAGQDLLVRADDTGITGPDSLNGKKLCSVVGSTSAEKIKDQYAEQVDLIENDNYSKCVTSLVAGSVDAVTTDNVILAGFAAQEQYAGKVKVVGNPFSEERYGVGLKKGDTEMCEQVNEALTAMIEDGSWETALSENAGSFEYDASANPPELDACP